MLRKSIAGLAAGVVTMALALPIHAAEWIMASGYPDNNFHTKNISMFIKEIESGTGGKLKITLNSNGTLIKLDATKRAVQAGQIPIGEIRLGVYGNEDPMYVLAGLPFIAPNYQTAWLLKDVQKPYFDALFEKNGMKVLYYAPWPGQGFYTKFPVNKTADFKGKKLRIYSTATQKMGEMLGFNATILPFAEIPQAFSTGLIEALFTSPQTGIDIQAWDNTSNFTFAGAIHSKNAVVVNLKAWKRLDAATQAVVLKAAANAEMRGFELSGATTREQIKILEKNGMKTANAPDAVIADMKEIGAAMVEEWKKKASPEAIEVLNRYLSLIQ
jgi:TRAP-type C4-dicarboxylate transport system substrate-binding protein